MDMHNDISKRTVLVLLVLTLVVSVVGTWTILSMPRQVTVNYEGNGWTSGQSRVGVVGPEAPIPPASVGGVSSVNVLK